MSNFNSADIAAFKDVWVFCEQREGKLMPTDFELISKGRDLANELGVNLCGLLLGGEGIESAAKELGGYGADKVIVCESPLLATYTTDAYAKVICDVISEMKPDAVVLNMARGGIVNEKDMYEALKAGKIGGYASDVMENELAAGGLTEGATFDSPLFECDNFIVSPHIGAQSVDASRDIGLHIISKVKEALSL